MWCCVSRSVRELQMTCKTDVFAFGVVLAELITGQRALIRDTREPNKMRALVTIVSQQLSFCSPASSRPSFRR